MTTDVIAIICVSLIAMAAVVVVRVAGSGLAPAATSFVATSGVAALAAVASSVVYAVFARHGSVVTLAAGDAVMVLGPSLVWAAVRQLNARRQAGISFAALSAGGVFVVSVLVPQPASLYVKVAVLAVFCILVAVEGSRRPAGVIRGMRWVTLTTIGYAAFCLGRIVVGLSIGVDSELYRTLFSIRPTTIAGTVCIATITIGVVLTARALRAPAPGDGALSPRQLRQATERLLAGGVALPWHRVVVDDMGLLRRAHGRTYADALHAALLAACRSASPSSRMVGSIGKGAVLVIGSSTGSGAGPDSGAGAGPDSGSGSRFDEHLVRDLIAHRAHTATADGMSPTLTISHGTLSPGDDPSAVLAR